VLATEVRLDVTGKSVPTNEPPAAIPVGLAVAAPLAATVTRVAIVAQTPLATPDPTAALAAAT